MTSEGSFKRRCIIKKLDFENCIATNIKTKARGRRKLRARITREVKDVEKSPEEISRLPNDMLIVSPVFSQRVGFPSREKTSPVLIRKQFKVKEQFGVLNKKRKIFDFEKSGESPVASPAVKVNSSQGSPVFKVQSSKFEFVNNSVNQCRKKKGNDGECSVNSDASDNTEKLESVASESWDEYLQDCYEIEEFTQEPEETVEISSVESKDTEKASSVSYSIDSKSDSNSEASKKCSSEKSDGKGKEQVIGWAEGFSYKDQTETVRKKYKKNSLRGRLEKLLRKQASEKLISQFYKREKLASTNLTKLSVIKFWNEGTNFILKCESVVEDEKIAYLFVNSQWIPSIQRVKEGSMLHLYPPWQKVKVEDSAIHTLLSVVCIEILDEIKEPVMEKISYMPSPTDGVDRKLFVESLFSSNVSGLLF